MNPRDVRSFLSPLSQFDPVRVGGSGTLDIGGSAVVTQTGNSF